MDNGQRISELRKQIEYHSNRYYNEDNPEITDYEFDQLMQELKKLEKENPELITKDSPTQKVGGAARRKPCVCSAQCADAKPAGCVFQRRCSEICRGDEGAVRGSGICGRIQNRRAFYVSAL